MTTNWKVCQLKRFSNAVPLAPDPATKVSTATHSVENQASALSDFNAYECDPSLTEAVSIGGAAWAASWVFSWELATASWSSGPWSVLSSAPARRRRRPTRHLDTRVQLLGK